VESSYEHYNKPAGSIKFLGLRYMELVLYVSTPNVEKRGYSEKNTTMRYLVDYFQQ
jgi:hypothetical protein